MPCFFKKFILFAIAQKNYDGSSLAYKKCVCLNNFKALIRIFLCCVHCRFFFFFLDKKETKNQERNMLSTLSVQMLKQYKSNCLLRNKRTSPFCLFFSIYPFTPNACPHFFLANTPFCLIILDNYVK